MQSQAEAASYGRYYSRFVQLRSAAGGVYSESLEANIEMMTPAILISVYHLTGEVKARLARWTGLSILTRREQSQKISTLAVSLSIPQACRSRRRLKCWTRKIVCRMYRAIAMRGLVKVIFLEHGRGSTSERLHIVIDRVERAN